MQKFVGVLALLCVFGVVDAADKDKKTKKPPKNAKKATVDKVDAKDNILVVKWSDGKKTSFIVGKAVKFYGPRGGESDDAIKDDRLKAGAKLLIVADGKKLKTVYFTEQRKPKKDKK